MKNLPYKSIFECSFKELQDRVQPEIQRVQDEQLKAGLYNLYQYDGNDDAKNLFVRKYADHRELVMVDATTGQSHIINSNF